MVRSYLRHGPTQAFGIITSPIGNSAFDGRLAFVPGWEDVLVWDVKMGEMVRCNRARQFAIPAEGGDS